MKYDVIRYSDDQKVGDVELTEEQFGLYEGIAQQPQGIIRLGDQVAIKNDLYELDEEYQDLGPDVTIYLS